MLKLYCTLFLLLCLPFFGCIKNPGPGISGGTATNSQAEKISADKVNQLIRNKEAFTLIDSRPTAEFSQAHLPSAISVPACEQGKHLELLPEDKEQLLVFYCGWPGCSMNSESADRAVQAGYTNILFMKGGLEEWIDSDLPTIASDIFTQQGHCLIIDLRPAHKNTVQRIPRSISIPFTTLSEHLNSISRDAAIVLYSDIAKESLDALTQFRSAGFDTVSMVEGNFKGWQRRGNPITSGPVVTTAKWVRKKGDGEVTLAEFKLALAGHADAILLDVRTPDEVAAGKLAATLHIPLEELSDRADELPGGKKIYIHCSNGSRAEMASWILEGAGYTTFALHATLKCNQGACELSD